MLVARFYGIKEAVAVQRQQLELLNQLALGAVFASAS